MFCGDLSEVEYQRNIIVIASLVGVFVKIPQDESMTLDSVLIGLNVDPKEIPNDGKQIRRNLGSIGIEPFENPGFNQPNINIADNLVIARYSIVGAYAIYHLFELFIIFPEELSNVGRILHNVTPEICVDNMWETFCVFITLCPSIPVLKK